MCVLPAIKSDTCPLRFKEGQGLQTGETKDCNCVTRMNTRLDLSDT